VKAINKILAKKGKLFGVEKNLCSFFEIGME
jgi:hypothetical protein